MTYFIAHQHAHHAECDVVFTRDAMRKRGLCYCPVSVHLSVTFVYCNQTAEDIVKFLSRLGSAIILVKRSLKVVS